MKSFFFAQHCLFNAFGGELPLEFFNFYFGIFSFIITCFAPTILFIHVRSLDLR